MSKHQELIDLWRKTAEPSFLVWLTKQEEKCEFCESPCGKDWCLIVKETFEEFDETLEKLSKALEELRKEEDSDV